MVKSEIYERNIEFNENTKILIGIGDSFCAGTGTESIEIWEKNKWDVQSMRNDSDGVNMGYDNSFINLLTKKYLTDYVPVNLGIAGKGNRFAIRELFSNPLFKFENAGEKIVIFVASGLERFDVTNDLLDLYCHTHTIWPVSSNSEDEGYSKIMKENKTIYSDKFIVGEFIMDMFMLSNWCKLNNAKLFFISGFSDVISKEKLTKILIDGRENDILYPYLNRNAEGFMNNIPWNSQIKPLGYDTIVDLMLHKQGRDDLIGDYQFRNYNVDKHTENDYVSKCQHPTKKGHELLCDVIYSHIKENIKHII
jgi:hypothetical protein